MNKQDVVNLIIADKIHPVAGIGKGSAPANIALVKYWGKRNDELNLPVTSSLSVSLGNLGTTTTVEPIRGRDEIILNGLPVPADTRFAQRLAGYLDLFRSSRDSGFRVITTNTIPTAAGLASSASGFAALALALNELFNWKLTGRELSILARLGSGSASRSIYHGLVQWHAGSSQDGMDSFAEPVPLVFPGLMIGVVKISVDEKGISSRLAMKQTVQTSLLYHSWPAQVDRDMASMLEALRQQDLNAVGKIAENNALSMHATALSAWPPTLFWWPESVKAMHQIWKLRTEGLPIYFTMDAGPNLKLITTKSYNPQIEKHFPDVEWIEPLRIGVSP